MNKKNINSKDIKIIKKLISEYIDNKIEFYNIEYSEIYSQLHKSYVKIDKVIPPNKINLSEKIRYINNIPFKRISVSPKDVITNNIYLFSGLEEITIDCLIGNITFNIWFFKRLKEINNLSNMTIRQYPLNYIHQTIFDIKSLKTLDLEFNRIEEIGVNISNLKYLKLIRLKGNPITKNNSEMANLKNLLPNCNIEI